MSSQRVMLSTGQFSWVCAAVLAALVPYATRFPAWFLALLLGLMALRWLQRWRRPQALSRWLMLPLTLALIGCVIAAYGHLFARAPGSALLAGMLVLKLLEGDYRRDALLTITLAWFLMMVAFLFDQSLAKAVTVVVLLPITLAALVALGMPKPALRGWRQHVPAVKTHMRLASLLLLQAIPLALVAFILLPRLSSPLWGTPDEPRARTGLTDRMAPGSMIELLLDDSPAMRVSFENTTPGLRDMYWRALVLWQFDGTAWTQNPWPQSADFEAQTPSVEASQIIEYEIVLEPSDTHWLPMLDRPIQAPQGARLSWDLQARSTTQLISVSRYLGQSVLGLPLDTQLGASKQQLMRQLPEGYNPDTMALIQQWRGELGNQDRALVQRALEYFHEQPFIYTYAPPLLGRNSVDDFLFSTRAGFCEHYASAFAVMMRSAGIPARVIIGYQGGFHNRAGDYWVVRNSDAHAWNEVWLEGEGWQRVDPTSYIHPERVFAEGGRGATRSSRFDGSSLFSAIYQQFDRAGHWWRRAVLQFNANRQKQMLERLGLHNAGTRELLILLTLALILALGTLTWLALRPGGVRSRDPLVRLWWRFVHRLQKRGLAVSAWQGPRALSDTASRSWPEQGPQLQAICGEFEQLHYAGLSPPAGERLKALATRIAKLELHKLPRK